jgi:hypothetical protein
VHFTKAGAVKLASYVDRELRRVMSTHVAPVALPAPEAAPKSGTVGTRPDVGPVVPLTANETESSDLVGAGGHTNPALSDPTADKVLSQGDPLSAPAGRADDFSWPRPSASATPEAAPQPASLTPAPAAKSDKKPADSSKDAKSKLGKESAKDSGKDSATTRQRRPSNANLDGAPVPPAPVGSR